MTSCPERAVQALLRGHQCAKRLKVRLEDPAADHESLPSHEDLVETIKDCLSDALSILIDTTCVNHQSCEFSSTMSSPPLRPSYNFQRGSPEKRYNPRSGAGKDRPGHKMHTVWICLLNTLKWFRRKRSNTEASGKNWRDDSPAPIYYDGFLWRKYGQKKIKASEHQRSYYRCAYMDDDHCEARKQVQKIEDNPVVYRTTYLGRHTCRINQDAIFPAVFDPNFESARMIEFGKVDQKSNSTAVNYQEMVKMESVEEEINQDQDQYTTEKENQSNPSDRSPPWSPSDLVFGSSLFLDGSDPLDAFDQYWTNPFDQFDFAGF